MEMLRNYVLNAIARDISNQLFAEGGRIEFVLV